MRKLKGIEDNWYQAVLIIYESLINGQCTQVGRQIEEYGIKHFIVDYDTVLGDIYPEDRGMRHSVYRDTLIAWARYKGDKDDER